MFMNLPTSRSLLIKLGSVLAMSSTLMLFGCAQLSHNNPGEKVETTEYPDLRKRLDSGDYAAVIVVGGKQGTGVFAAGGKEVTDTPCGRVAEDGTIVDNEKLPEDEQCNLKSLDLLNLSNMQMFTTQHNPLCTYVRWGPYLVKVHAGGDGYPPGAYPCHVGPH